jgi:DNA-binding transcriptional regulator YhcF (GntR family)
MLTIHLDSPIPITEQLAAGLRRAIATGELQVGALLPTVRQLAADLGVNLNTVARAYRNLEAQGLCATAGRRGTRVTAERMDRAAARTTRAELEARLAGALADAALAGLDRGELLAITHAQLDRFLPAD